MASFRKPDAEREKKEKEETPEMDSYMEIELRNQKRVNALMFGWLYVLINGRTVKKEAREDVNKEFQDIADLMGIELPIIPE